MTPRRRSPLPPGWPKLRRHILARDGEQCRLRLPGCEGKATEVHHTRAHNDHRPEHLVSACTRCHATVTGQDAIAARRKAERRQPTRHPGVTP